MVAGLAPARNEDGLLLLTDDDQHRDSPVQHSDITGSNDGTGGNKHALQEIPRTLHTPLRESRQKTGSDCAGQKVDNEKIHPSFRRFHESTVEFFLEIFLIIFCLDVHRQLNPALFFFLI